MAHTFIYIISKEIFKKTNPSKIWEQNEPDPSSEDSEPDPPLLLKYVAKFVVRNPEFSYHQTGSSSCKLPKLGAGEV